jgi:acylphosphatase
MVSEYVARQVVVHGLVQGVFFRDTCRREAERLGVAGWIRNEPDGTVAGHFEGPAHAVEELVRWCQDGPPRARVARVDVQEVEAQDAQGFAAF